MIKSIGKLTLATILAASVLGMPLSSLAQSTNSTPPSTAPAKPKLTRFRGTLGSVDKTASTITVDNKNGPKRTFEVTSDTKIMKAGKPATLDDATVGDSVSGSYTTNSSGKMITKSLNLGPRTGAAATPPPAAK